MATLLTSDSTLESGESCAPAAADPGPEVPSVLWAAGTFGGLESVGIRGPVRLSGYPEQSPGDSGRISLSRQVDTANWFVCYNIAAVIVGA